MPLQYQTSSRASFALAAAIAQQSRQAALTRHNDELVRTKDVFGEVLAMREAAASCAARLTNRQLQIMDMVVAGKLSKNIAWELGISQRTVENHRAAIMRKTGSKSLPALARFALAASCGEQAAA